MPDDPTITVTQEQLDRLKQLEEARSRLIAQESQLRQSNNLTAEAYKNLSVAIASTDEEIRKITTNMTLGERTSRALADAVKSVKEQFGPLGDVVGNLIQNIGGGLVEAAEKFGGVLASLNPVLRGFINPLQDGQLTIFSFSRSLREINEAVSNLRQAQTTARVSATLFGQSIDMANKAASVYPQALRRSASATAITTRELNEMNQTMKIIPDTMRLVQGGFAGITSIQQEAIQPTAILATVSRAFGMTTAEAASMGVEAWKNFGQTVEETVRQMGNMAEAARQARVDRRTAREQIQQASASLAIFGQRTASAANIWTTFMTSLRSAGVPISEVGSIVENVTRSIAGMSVQHRAFIGMMSGLTRGRTALGGAIQLELAMRSPEGMQQNIKALTSTLSQFAGGKIITLEEAARNPQLEMQFQLQRQLLQNLTGIAGQEQQNRILETLQNVQRGGISQIEGGRELQNVYQEGRNILERQLTVLQRIEQGIMALSGNVADQQLEDLDESFRSLRDIGQELGGTRAFLSNIATAPAGAPVTSTSAGLRAMEALGMQFRRSGMALGERQSRRQEESSRDLMQSLGAFAPGLFGTFEREPQVRARQPRLPAREPIPAAVPIILGEPTVQQRGVVPDIRQPNVLSILTRQEDKKMQIMTELLGSVKEISSIRRAEVPEVLFTPREGAEIRRTPAVTTTQGETTSTIIVKITDERRTDMSKKIHDDILNAVNKSTLGISY